MSVALATPDETPADIRTKPPLGRLAFIRDLIALTEQHPTFAPFVERWIREMFVPPADFLRPLADEVDLWRTNKIRAIQMYRHRTGASLKDAKEAIEQSAD